MMMMIIMMIMVLPCSKWRKGMLAFSSLSPPETECSVAWRGRLAQQEDGGGGVKVKTLCANSDIHSSCASS